MASNPILYDQKITLFTILFGKTPGNITYMTSQRKLGVSMDSMDMNLSKARETVEDRGAWQATIHGVAESEMT